MGGGGGVCGDELYKWEGWGGGGRDIRIRLLVGLRKLRLCMSEKMGVGMKDNSVGYVGIWK